MMCLIILFQLFFVVIHSVFNQHSCFFFPNYFTVMVKFCTY